MNHRSTTYFKQPRELVAAILTVLLLSHVVVAQVPTAAQNVDESLDEIVEKLKSGDTSFKNLYKPLTTLQRLPVDEQRRREVALYLDPVLTAQDSSVRRAAHGALRNWGTDLNIVTLTKLTTVEDRNERRYALETLGEIGGKEAAKAVAARIGNQQDDYYALKAMEKIGFVGEEFLWPYLTTPDSSLHNNLCDVLAKVGKSRTLSRLKAMRHDKDSYRRSNIEAAIKDIERRLK